MISNSKTGAQQINGFSLPAHRVFPVIKRGNVLDAKKGGWWIFGTNQKPAENLNELPHSIKHCSYNSRTQRRNKPKPDAKQE